MHRKGIVHVHTKFQINALFSVAVISYVVRYLLYTYVTLNYVECGTQAVKNIIWLVTMHVKTASDKDNLIYMYRQTNWRTNQK